MVEFKVGDRVMFSRVFLRSTGQLTGSVPFAVGTVKLVMDELPAVRVRWDGGDGFTSMVLTRNLIHKDRRHLETV